MRRIGQFFKKYSGHIIFGLIPVLVVVVPIAGFFLFMGLGACITEERNIVYDLAGYDFEISETNCDTIAKDDAVSVFVSHSGRDEKVLILKYDPGRNLSPTFAAVGPHRIRIALGVIKPEIFLRVRQWEDLLIDYDIDADQSSDSVGSNRAADRN